MDSKKKKKTEILEAWTNLKEKILSHLDTHQLVKEQIMENYDKKLKTKETLIEELETDYKDLASKYKKLVEKSNTMVNKEDYAVLENKIEESNSLIWSLKSDINKNYDRMLFSSDAKRADFYEKEVISLKNKIDSFTFDDDDGPTIEEVD